MSIIHLLNEDLSVLASDLPSDDNDISQMIKTAPMEIPTEYLEIIKEKTEIEISVKGEKILRIWGAKGCVEMNEAYGIQNYLKNSWAIGDDEGGYAIVYSKKNSDLGVYAVSFSDLEDDEMIFLSKSLSEFLCLGKGLDVFTEF